MAGWKRYYMDAEFTELTLKQDGTTLKPLDMISIGIVDERGREFYAVSNEFNRQAAGSLLFLKNEVLSKLPPDDERQSRADIRGGVLDFIGLDNARFYYWYLPQDWMVFSDLMSDYFLNMPKQIYPFGINLAQTWVELGQPDILPKMDTKQQHNALYDAKWLKRVHEKLLAYEATLQDKPKPRGYRPL